MYKLAAGDIWSYRMYLDAENRQNDLSSLAQLDALRQVNRDRFQQFDEITKRTFDIAFSLISLVVILPFLAIVALAIRLESPGPAFFVQRRWGQGKRVIQVFKFRSMFIEACDETGVCQTIDGDPRITWLGRWLRSSNIDELPQLFNVLRGDMSLVGPRCHAIGMKAAGMLYEELVPEYHLRHLVRPGMTGLAQVRGWRGPTQSALSAKARLLCDLHYVKSRTFLLDMKILVATIRKEIIRGSGS